SDKKREPLAFDSATPQHIVETKAYQIARFPVTVAEYACAVRTKAVREPPRAGFFSWKRQLAKPDHAVETVPWIEAIAYATWLANLSGQPWHLPTEAQWEKAARGTDRRTYPWGDKYDKTRARVGKLFGGAVPVGSYPSGASPYGVQDMAGNVW